MDRLNQTRVIAVLGLAIAVIGLGVALTNRPVSQDKEIGGTPGNILAEQYDPYIMYNGGFKTAKPIETDDTLTAADITTDAGVTVGTDLVVGGTVLGDLKTTAITATTTVTAAQSGTTFLLSASANQETITLPAVAAGLYYRFLVTGALTGTSVQITSTEKDNIDGTLIVAGAVVDCRAEDYINIVTDGEVIGDYVEVYSDGVQWFIGDSGVLTTAKMTCTDPS